jgi:hypothetical protein
VFLENATQRDDESRKNIHFIENPFLKREFSRICDLKQMNMDNKSNNIKRMIQMNSLLDAEYNKEERTSTVQNSKEQ